MRSKYFAKLYDIDIDSTISYLKKKRMLIWNVFFVENYEASDYERGIYRC
ncbi:hypothetical protein ES708_22683 [subsurface metagenome]|jgi:hypothetical protein